MDQPFSVEENMRDFDKSILQQINEDHPRVVELRRYFHKNPEIAKEEFNTATRIEDELDLLGLHHQRVGETGVYSEIKGTLPGERIIVLRADIDALPIQETHECEYKSRIPNRMHACGHDSHAASLLGAAKILCANRDSFGGTIRLCFQQGEEIGYGARLFVDGGFLDGAHRCFGVHAASNIATGKIAVVPGANNASVDWFKINVHGAPAHVSTPQLGSDAVYIASQIVVSLQAIITRTISPMENVLVGIGKITAGDAYNIVAKSAELEGTVRVFDGKIRKEVRLKMEKLASNIAESFGGSVSFEWTDFTSPLVNNPAVSLEVQQTADRIFGAENVIKERTPALGGDDFAEFILKVPGVYAYFGTGNPEKAETTASHHDSVFDIDEDGMLTSTAIYTFYALDFLSGK